MRRVYALFFLSGAAGLVYQVVWSRLLHEIFGVTVYAITTVLATFLGGLALGALILGRVADRGVHPLRLYGWLEIGIALAAALGVWTIRLTEPFHHWAANRFEPDSAALMLVRALLGALVVFPPTFLMGGTLPAVTRFAVRRMRSLGRELSLLYSLNTAGAVAGAVLAGFVLIRALGVHNTLWLAALTNLVLGLAALRIATRSGVAGPPSPAEPREARPGGGGRGLLVVMALSGFVTLALEIFWTRILMLSVGTTTYSFATMLTSFLTGIALGGYLARIAVNRIRDLRRAFGWLQLAIAGSILAALPLIDAGLTQRWLSGWGGDWLALLVLRFGVSLLIMLVPTTLIGMTFPLAARIRARDLGHLGCDLGEVYGCNTLGNILGAVLGGFVLLPVLGLQKGVAALTTLNLVSAAWGFLSGAPARGGVRALMRGAPVAVGIGLCIALVLVWQPRPFAIWGESDADTTLYYNEGVVATVKVIQKAHDPRQVWMAVDSIKIGESYGGVDLKQQALAHFPFLLRPQAPPGSVLSIGLGTGIVIGETVRHPGVREVDCLEISPSVIEAASLFDAYNGGVLRNPAVRVINDDGVNFLRRTAKRYDAIISDAKSRTTHAANSLFFSRDYYALCRKHLVEGGLMIQWVPLNVPPFELRTILRTFASVFSHVFVWTAPPHSCFVVGQERMLILDPGEIERRLRDPIYDGLHRYGMSRGVDFLGALTADGDSMRDWLSFESALNSLEHPVLEFYSFRDYAVPPGRRADKNLLGLVRGRAESLVGVRLVGHDPEPVKATRRALDSLAEGARLLERDDPDSLPAALRLVEEAVDTAPDQRTVRYAAAAAYRRAIAIDPSEPRAHCGLARLLRIWGSADAALDQYREAARIDPDDVEALTGMASILARHPRPERRDPAEAIRLALRAVELTGRQSVSALATLAEAYAAAARKDEALETLGAAVALAERTGHPMSRGLRQQLRSWSTE